MEALEARLANMESMLQQPSNTGQSRPPETQESSSSSSDGETSLPSISSGLLFQQLSDQMAAARAKDCLRPLSRTIPSSLTFGKSELWLLQRSLDETYAELPLFNMPWFLDQVQWPDALGRPDAWWQAMLASVVASAILSKAADGSFSDVAVYAWSIFRNAYALLPELILDGDGTGALQAVMALVMFMRQSADTRTTSRLLSMAARMQPHISSQTKDESVHQENETRVSWAIFVLDMDMAMNTGLPTVHSAPPTGNLATNSENDSIFRLRFTLAQIQHLLLPHLATPDEPSLLSLQAALEHWHLSLPPVTSESTLPLVLLHLTYHTTHNQILWTLIQHLSALHFSDPPTLSALTHTYKTTIRTTARTILALIPRIPISLLALWPSLPHAVSATIILLAVICKEPTHPEARQDITLLQSFVAFLNRAISRGCPLQKLRDGVSKFASVAQDAVDVAEKEAMPVNPALWPLSVANGETGKSVSLLLTCEVKSPMGLAWALLGREGVGDMQGAKRLCAIVDVESEGEFGAFVPEEMVPGRYGFRYAEQGTGGW